MRCPTLAELPPPPPGRTGWPWTEESEQLPETMPDGTPWPKISIVTPNYNYGRFIEKTIRSVLLQGYPNLEYIIMDGGSDDSSVDIIRRYAPWLTYWESKSDRGQSHAINRGFAKATGDLFAWINSDDYYRPRAFYYVANALDPDDNLLVGVTKQEGPKGTFRNERVAPSLIFEDVIDWSNNHWFRQPGCFFSKDIFEEVNGLDERLHYAMDFDLWLKILSRTSGKHIAECLAIAKIHPVTKTQIGRDKLFAEQTIVQIKHGATDLARARLEQIYERKQKLETRFWLFIKLGRLLRRFTRIA